MDPTSTVGSVLAAFGLSGSAGLNAWLPLFVSALLERSGVVHLAEPFHTLSQNAGLVVLGVLMALDLIGDKLPVVDHALHLAGTVVAPVSGALLFVGQTADHSDSRHSLPSCSGAEPRLRSISAALPFARSRPQRPRASAVPCYRRVRISERERSSALPS